MDYLIEDSLLPSGQKFVCLSFLQDTEKKSTLCGLKIRGAFETYEDACAHAKRLQEADSYHHVFVGEMGKWLPFDPDTDSKAVKDSVYANEQLNNMMKSYMENQEKAKLYHEHRKNEMVRNNLLENMNIRKETLKDLKQQLKKSSDEKKMDIERNIKSVQEQIAKMENKKADVEKELEELTKKLDLNKLPEFKQN